MSKYISTLVLPHDVGKMAELYKSLPDEIVFISFDERTAFRKLINLQFQFVSNVMDILFVDEEPYGQDISLAKMEKDFRKGILRIHTTGNDSAIWGKFHNLQFRAIHDYIHLVSQLDFNHRDEVAVYKAQIEFSMDFGKHIPYLNWEKYNQILRSEIVYQSAVKEADSSYHIDQKVILSDRPLTESVIEAFKVVE